MNNKKPASGRVLLCALPEQLEFRLDNQCDSVVLYDDTMLPTTADGK